jgi:hypothetical protein
MSELAERIQTSPEGVATQETASAGMLKKIEGIEHRAVSAYQKLLQPSQELAGVYRQFQTLRDDIANSIVELSYSNATPATDDNLLRFPDLEKIAQQIEDMAVQEESAVASWTTIDAAYLRIRAVEGRIVGTPLESKWQELKEQEIRARRLCNVVMAQVVKDRGTAAVVKESNVNDSIVGRARFIDDLKVAEREVLRLQDEIVASLEKHSNQAETKETIAELN